MLLGDVYMSKVLYEFIKIEDESLEATQEKFKDIPQDTIVELLKLNPKYREGNVDNTGRWILNLYKNKNLKKEDFYKVPEALEKFEKYKKYLKQKDLNQYKSLPQLFEAVDNVEVTQTPSEIKRNIKKTDINKDAELVASTAKYNVYVPKTYEASCKLGAGTHWCTASNSDSRYYENYSSQGPLYILIDKGSGKAEYQLHFESGQFMNKDDSPVSFSEIIGDDTEMSKFIVNIIKSKPEYIEKYKYEIIEAPFAEEFLDQIKEWYAKDNYIIDDIMKNSKLHKYYEKEIETELANHAYKASNFIWDKELALGKYKKNCMEYLGFKDGVSQIEIGNDWFAKVLEKYSKEKHSRDYFSEDFFNSCLSGDLFDLFDNYYESGANRYNFESDIDDQVKKALEELHLEYKNIPQDAIDRAVDEGNIVGSEDECYKDFTNAMTDAAKGIPFELGYDHSTWHISYEDYLNLIYKFKNEIDEGYDVDSIKPDEFLPWYVAKDFDLTEPYYGWNDFSEEAFNDRLYEEIYDTIVNEEEDPEFDDDEELDKWKEWFENDYKKK